MLLILDRFNGIFKNDTRIQCDLAISAIPQETVGTSGRGAGSEWDVLIVCLRSKRSVPAPRRARHPTSELCICNHCSSLRLIPHQNRKGDSCFALFLFFSQEKSVGALRVRHGYCWWK